MQPVQEQVHDELGVPLDGRAPVQEPVVALEHAPAEVLDLGEHLGRRDLARLELPPVRPDYAHHLVDLEADEGEERRRPAFRRARVARRAGGELVFLAVVGQPGVVVLPPDGRLGTLGLARSDV